MEYKDTFKNDQGVELEIKAKAECPTDESMFEALSFIAQSLHRFYSDTAEVCKEETEGRSMRGSYNCPEKRGEKDIWLPL